MFSGLEDPDTEALANLTCLICAKAVVAEPPKTRATSMAVTKAAAASHTTTRAMGKSENSPPKTTAREKSNKNICQQNNPQPTASPIRRRHQNKGQNGHPPKQ